MRPEGFMFMDWKAARTAFLVPEPLFSQNKLIGFDVFQRNRGVHCKGMILQ